MTALTTQAQPSRYEKEDDGRESIWTFPSRWRVRFFVIFYSLLIASTAWGTYETVTVLGSIGLNYRDFITVYVQSIAGSAELDTERRGRERKLRTEAVEYGRLVATYEARGEEPPPPPWESNEN